MTTNIKSSSQWNVHWTPWQPVKFLYRISGLAKVCVHVNMKRSRSRWPFSPLQILIKVEVPEMDAFLSASASSDNMKHTIIARWLANSNCTCSHLPHNFWSSNEYLIHYQVNYSMLIYWWCMSPQSCWLLSLICFACVKHIVQSLSNTCIVDTSIAGVHS